MEKKYQKCFSHHWMEQKRKCINCPVDLWDFCRKETKRRKRCNSNGEKFRPMILPRMRIEIDKKSASAGTTLSRTWMSITKGDVMTAQIFLSATGLHQCPKSAKRATPHTVTQRERMGL